MARPSLSAIAQSVQVWIYKPIPRLYIHSPGLGGEQLLQESTYCRRNEVPLNARAKDYFAMPCCRSGRGLVFEAALQQYKEGGCLQAVTAWQGTPSARATADWTPSSV